MSKEGIEVTQKTRANREGRARAVERALRGSQVLSTQRHEDGTYTIRFYNHTTKAVNNLDVYAGNLTENV